MRRYTGNVVPWAKCGPLLDSEAKKRAKIGYFVRVAPGLDPVNARCRVSVARPVLNRRSEGAAPASPPH
jgi:hypothetical protein